MKIAILSDTHNNLANLDSALEHIRREGVTTLLHCGDLTDPGMLSRLAGLRVIYTYGNGDVASGVIRQTLLDQDPENFAGMVYTGKIGDTQLAATHGHIPGRLEELIESGIYEFVFHGHSHSHRDVRIKTTRVINPGALGGLRRESRQFCLLDLATSKAQFIYV